MHSGEFTFPSWKEFTADRLSSCDVAVDSHSSPYVVTITLKRSKNDPSAVGMGIKLYIHRCN